MTNLLTATPAEFCAATDACPEGRKFALGYATMAEVWDNCPKPGWLLWITDRLDRMPDDRTLRLFAVWCARQTPIGDGRVTGDLLTDPRSLAALDVAEKYANGQATDGELTTAGDAARVAAARVAAACAAYAAAFSAARAHTFAAAAACAAYAAAAARVSAAYAAAYAAYAAAADAAQADQFRRMVPNPFRP